MCKSAQQSQMPCLKHGAGISELLSGQHEIIGYMISLFVLEAIPAFSHPRILDTKLHIENRQIAACAKEKPGMHNFANGKCP